MRYCYHPSFYRVRVEAQRGGRESLKVTLWGCDNTGQRMGTRVGKMAGTSRVTSHSDPYRLAPETWDSLIPLAASWA